MSRRTRLDQELVRRHLASSRTEAQKAINEGLVLVGGMPATRAATQVDPTTPIVLNETVRRFVSRGGDKLDHFLAQHEIVVRGRRWLDAGASTGGFTDVLLQSGAAAVTAVDVGYGQLDFGLREDPRVHVLERTNVRAIDPEMLPWRPDAVVADLSFISLRLVLPALVTVMRQGGDLVLLVKPQFEAGRDAVGRGGVVRDPEVWHRAISGVVETGRDNGVGLEAVSVAEPPGPAGNREFFVHLTREGNKDIDEITEVVAKVDS